MSLRQAIASLVAVLVGWLGLFPPGAAVAAQVLVPTAHAYNSPIVPATQGFVFNERGSPSAFLPSTTYDAVGRWPNGALLRLDAGTPLANTAHDTHRRLVQVARVAGTTHEQAPGGRRARSAFAPNDVAAKSADEVADIGHAGIHQFPGIQSGKSQFFDGLDLGQLASRTKGMDGFVQPNGNTRYVLRVPGGAGVDKTSGLPTDVFTVIRRPDGSGVTMFPGTSPKG